MYVTAPIFKSYSNFPTIFFRMTFSLRLFKQTIGRKTLKLRVLSLVHFLCKWQKMHIFLTGKFIFFEILGDLDLVTCISSNCTSESSLTFGDNYKEKNGKQECLHTFLKVIKTNMNEFLSTELHYLLLQKYNC